MAHQATYAQSSAGLLQRDSDAWMQELEVSLVLQELDPGAKFKGESNIWRWEARQNGKVVDFKECCGPSGFDKSCVCANRADCGSK